MRGNKTTNTTITAAEMVFLGDILRRLSAAVDRMSRTEATVTGTKKPGPLPGKKRGRPAKAAAE